MSFFLLQLYTLEQRFFYIGPDDLYRNELPEGAEVDWDQFI